MLDSAICNPAHSSCTIQASSILCSRCQIYSKQSCFWRRAEGIRVIPRAISYTLCMQSLDSQKNEAFSHLFPCVIRMLDQIKEVKDHPNREYYSWAIVKIIIRKVASASILLQPVPLPLDKKGQTISDPLSVAVIVRSILEAYLIWEKIFILAESAEEKEFWYFAWALQSLKPRTEITLPLPEEETEHVDPKTGRIIKMKAKDAQENIRKNVHELHESLRKNTWYLSNVGNKPYLKGYVENGWKMSTKKLLEKSMPSCRNQQMYEFSSATAHLDHMDVLQTTKAHGHEKIIEYAELSLNMLLSVLARLCIHLPDVFPHLLPIAQSLPRKTIVWIAARELVTTGEAEKFSDSSQKEA